jgi:hypothetical protein
MDNFADFFVVRGDFPQGGIQSKQGYIEHVTGNKLSTANDATWHFYNEGDHSIDYYYCNFCADEIPDENIIYNVQPEGINFANNCLSHYGGGGAGQKDPVLTAEQITETEQIYDSCLLEFNYYNTIFMNLKDGGDSQGLISSIENSQPFDMWDLREDMLDISPHLSLDALISFVDKTDVFPDTVMFEILSANPDELRKNELIFYLENKQDPLPASMIDQLRQTASDTTYKTVLLQQMAHYNQVKIRAAHDMIRSNLNDSTINLIEFRDWLSDIGGVRADEQIIASYMYENNLSEALNLAGQLPQKYNYDSVKLTKHAQYVDVLKLYEELWQETRSINELDSTELADIKYIAENNRTTAGSMARGILESWYGYNYCDCLNTIDTGAYKNNIVVVEPNTVENRKEINIIVKPNPANQWTVFDYKIPEEDVWGEIRITDINGRMIDSFKVSGIKGQQIWDTRNLQSGLYFYTFMVNEDYISGKVILLK